MPQMSSTYATAHATHDLIDKIHNPKPANPLVKIGNAHTSSTSEGASKGVIPRNTPEDEPRNNPNENFIPIKSINQFRISEGAYCGRIPR